MTTIALPEYIDFEYWATLLMSAFPSDYLPLNPTESGWQEWAAFVVSTPSFAKVSAPNPYDFQDWREWARRIVELF